MGGVQTFKPLKLGWSQNFPLGRFKPFQLGVQTVQKAVEIEICFPPYGGGPSLQTLKLGWAQNFPLGGFADPNRPKPGKKLNLFSSVWGGSKPPSP